MNLLCKSIVLVDIDYTEGESGHSKCDHVNRNQTKYIFKHDDSSYIFNEEKDQFIKHEFDYKWSFHDLKKQSWGLFMDEQENYVS